PLVSYTSGGIVYGRALVNLGNAPQPPPIAPGQQMTFTVRLYQVSSSTPPGSYTGNFLVTASANPIAFFSGTIQFADSLLDIQFLEYTLSLTNQTGGTHYTVDQPITLDFTVSRPTGMLEIPVGAYVWRVYAENGTLLDEVLWDNVTYTSINTTTYAPATTPKTYTFTEPGNYTIGLVPLLETGPLDDLETSANITVYPEIEMTPGTGMGTPLLILVLVAGAVLVLLIVLFTGKKP
ncbi:MAG: hypothetical protein QCI38_08245, partial [Candidatus Thermoplasmatota archaeon]|nr:hypothetical protein [Candidatus Thermoplasmatota archaeon]